MLYPARMRMNDSFFRSKEAKRVNPLGMGVSLLVVKTIVSAHGGSIGVGYAVF